MNPITDRVERLREGRDPLALPRVELLQLRERQFVDVAVAVRRSAHVAIVDQDRHAVLGDLNVEFKAIGSGFDRTQERPDRVFGFDGGRAAMAVDQHDAQLPSKILVDSA